jgi:micrococcal nuclease
VSFLLCTYYSFSQDTFIKPEEAISHIGENHTVCGVVASAKYADRTNRKPTFLNLNQPYPNQIFTAVIWGSDRHKFKTPPEMAYKGKRICVTGLIVTYKEIPEIIVEEPSQIVVKSE